MVDERRCALMERLRPIMGEDSSIAADILIQALRREFNELVEKEDQVRYQAAFDRLPQGSTAKPRLAFISHDNEAFDAHWSVTFTDGPISTPKLETFRHKGRGGQIRN
jgi:hypothetical protein